MIQGQIFNFDSNKLEASRYRISLRSSKIDSGIEAESFLLFRRFKFKNLDFSFRKRRNVLDAQLIDSNLRNLSYYLYYINKSINSIKRVEDSFYLKTKEYFKVLNKDISKLKSLIEETNVRLNSKYNRVKVFDIFQEKDFEEVYKLIDPKRGLRFLKKEQCDFKNGYIETKRTNRSVLDIVSIELIEENSWYSDSLKPIEITKDTSCIYRKDKFWHYIVAAVQSLNDLQELPHKNAAVELLINFDGYEDLNNIYIEFGSSLPVILNRNNISYYDKQSNGWKLLEEVGFLDEVNRCKVVFKTIRTNKIKLNLIQKKFHDTSLVFENEIDERIVSNLVTSSFLNASNPREEGEIKRVYDLSILHLECSRESNTELGFYREAKPVVLNRPLSLGIETKTLLENQNCFIEKYAHIVLYGEENFKAHKNKNKNFSNTKRVNKIIPLPNNNYKEVELLCLRNKISVVNLFPRLSISPWNDIEVKEINLETGFSRTLTMSTEYEYSLDGGSSFLNPRGVQNENYVKGIVPEIYNFLIKLKYPNKACLYVVEYVLNSKIYCGYGKDIRIENGELIFGKKFQSSVGFIRPGFIMRNKSKLNESSKIDQYKVLVEEIDGNESSYIEYEDFIEMERRGSSNVI